MSKDTSSSSTPKNASEYSQDAPPTASSSTDAFLSSMSFAHMQRGGNGSNNDDSTCPTIETIGMIDVPFNPAFLSINEIGNPKEESLFITSFFNSFGGRDLVAYIPNIGGRSVDDDEEEDDNEDRDDSSSNSNWIDTLDDPIVITDVIDPETPETVWPNDAIRAPDGMFPFEDAIVLPQGFHVASSPGRLVAIDVNSPDKTEYVIHQSQEIGIFTFPNDPNNSPRFYHHVVFYDVDKDGYEDIVTVRSGFRIIRSATPGPPSIYPPFGELVWFQNPGHENILMNPTQPWQERVVYGGPTVGYVGPDIDIAMADLEHDGIPEFVVTHFFSSGPNPDDGKIVLLGAPVDMDWSTVLTPFQLRTKVLDTNTPQGKPFDVEFVDINNDGQLDILATNHQPDGTSTWPSTIPGRVFAFENPGPDTIFSTDWTTHILLDNIRPNPTLPGATASRLAPGHAIPFYPYNEEDDSDDDDDDSDEDDGSRRHRSRRPWIVVGGDQASKVWLMKPIPNQEFGYDSTVIFDINDAYPSTGGLPTTQTPLFPFSSIAISTIGKIAIQYSKKKNGNGDDDDHNDEVLIYIPVFEAGDIHVIRLSFHDCDDD